ncbi:MAG: CapA family protein [Lachnospiraceae bacterium]|nr:CapA family protein [Lachnospiraceae bacterium]
MAQKKRKKKKGSFSLFLIALAITLTAGCTILAVCWALWGMDQKDNGTGSASVQESQAESADQAELQDSDDLTGAGGTQEGQDGSAGEDVSDEITNGEGMVSDNALTEPAGRYDELLADTAYCAANKIYAKETVSPDEVTLVFGGDILFDDRYAIMAQMNARGKGIEGSVSEEMLEVMRNADICMLNNEFPYTDRGEPTPGKKFTFRAKPEYASYLLDMGVDIVSLANNHAYDYGEISLTDSIDTLDALEIPFVGAGRNIEEAVKPVTFVANDMRIAILSATQIERYPDPNTPSATAEKPGVFRCLDISRLVEEIKKAKEENDFVIVYVHWGSESTDQPDWAQLEQAPQIAEAGADLVIGDHPHVLQGIVYHGATPVFYSLGNYLFNSKSQDTCLVEVKLDENGLKSLQFIPGRQQSCSVSMHHDEEKERVLSYIRALSPGVTITEEGFVNKAE